MLGLKKTDGNLMFLYAAYLAALSIGNVLDNSFVFLFGCVLPASVLAYPLTLLTLCVICELWGRGDAARLVLLGLGMKFVGVVLLGLAQAVKIFPDYGARRELWSILGTSFWEVSGHMILGKDVRFWTASIISFPIAQLTGLWVFDRMLRRRVERTGAAWGGRWARYLCGCMAGEAAEITLFLLMILAPDWRLFKIDMARQIYVRGIFTLMWLPTYYALTWRRRRKNA